jgi:segregation and condensation protein B
LVARVEAILFVASSPVSVGQLASALEASQRKVEGALQALAEECSRRGLRLQRHRSGYQMTTAPELAGDIERFLHLEGNAHLTRAALEVLSIVAYQQPVTRPQIDAVRGVNSDSPLRTLLRHGLLEEVGRREGPGRPILYATTPEFLQHFGLNSLEELPPLNPDLPGEFGEPGEGTEPRSGEGEAA